MRSGQVRGNGSSRRSPSLRLGGCATASTIGDPNGPGGACPAPCGAQILENVSKVYPDGTRAVSELDLAVEDGELMVFVGPSGCGKTSALR